MTDRLGRIINAAIYKLGLDVQYATEYAEPGYADPESKVILFANWNSGSDHEHKSENEYARKRAKTQDKLAQFGRIAEKLGAEIEWSDEWTTCCQCYKAVRTSPNGHGWQASFIMSDGGIDCKECLLGDPGDYVDSFLLNNGETADKFDVNLSALGFKKIESGENGFHPGQIDNPAAMAIDLTPADHDFVFQIDNVGQFDVHFTLWVRPCDHEE